MLKNGYKFVTFTKSKDMKINTSLLLILLLCYSHISIAQNTNKWVSLFNGNSTDQLRGYMLDSFPSEAWKVEDGALVTQTGVPNIDLVTKDTFTNFDLTFQWKVSKAGNSGVFYNVQESSAHESGNGNSPNWLDNFEMQLLDDIDFNDKAPIRSAGSLYDLIAPVHKHLKPVGEYNTARLLVDHGHVEHWINGEKEVAYQVGSAKLNELISKSKYKDNPKFAKSTSGHIMFQHHGQQVWLRDIQVKRL
jgi:hypothetical protein